MHSESEDLCLNSEVNPLALGFYGRFDRWIYWTPGPVE